MGNRKSKRRKDRAKTRSSESLRRDQVALWTLRILAHTEASRRLESLLSDEDVQEATGIGELPEEMDKAPRSRTRNLLTELVKKRLRALEKAGVDRSDAFFENIEKLGSVIGLKAVEKELLACVVMSTTERGLSECLEALPRVHSMRRLARSLSRVLGFREHDIRQAISSKSTLLATGLLKPERYRHDAPFEVADDLDAVLLREHPDEEALLRLFFKLGEPPTLAPGDYAHVEQHMGLLVRYLRAAVDAGRSGVNVLLFGPPGTGKTEFARLLAKEASIPLYEVEVEDSDGDPLKAERRTSAYLTCQRVLERQKEAVVLFDEVEDVFPGAHSLFLGHHVHISDRDKGWMNRVLEKNPAPTIWVCNAIHQIDPAYLRRFDYVMELDVPPRSVRRAVLNKHLDGLQVSQGWKETMSQAENITPADVERAAKVTRLSGATGQREAENTLEQVLGSALMARGHSLKKHEYRTDAPDYNLGFLNPSCDLSALIASMGRQPKGNVCMYGPPGTGKTAFAFHMAEVLDKELIVKRASDILNKWLGDTEQNIAGMFARVNVDRQILLLDEADSFFQDRGSAVRSWEITQVNELLVQMESFDGLFICATNLIDGFDQAAFRRFSLKVEFGYLKPGQRWDMFLSTLILLDSEDLNKDRDKARHRLDQLSKLTPGDFAAVRKRMRLIDTRPKPAQLVAALEEECSFKPGAKKGRIGF